MTAAGKINASNVQAGDRIVVRIERNDAGLFTGLHESRTKTHADDLVVRVTGKTFRNAQGPYEARGKYIIETTAGAFEAAPIQTMILAPEDTAGIKRALAEAIVEDEEWSRVRKALAELEAEEAAIIAEAQAPAATPALDEADAKMAAMTAEVDAHTEARTARCDNPWHRSAPARARKLCPECPDSVELETAQRELAEALDRWLPADVTLDAWQRDLLGRTLRPILEEGVRMARDIPEGRRRHGQIKARRDALRHARKLELASL